MSSDLSAGDDPRLALSPTSTACRGNNLFPHARNSIQFNSFGCWTRAYFIFGALCPSKSGLTHKHIVKHIEPLVSATTASGIHHATLYCCFLLQRGYHATASPGFDRLTLCRGLQDGQCYWILQQKVFCALPLLVPRVLHPLYSRHAYTRRLDCKGPRPKSQGRTDNHQVCRCCS